MFLAVALTLGSISSASAYAAENAEQESVDTANEDERAETEKEEPEQSDTRITEDASEEIVEEEAAPEAEDETGEASEEDTEKESGEAAEGEDKEKSGETAAAEDEAAEAAEAIDETEETAAAENEAGDTSAAEGGAEETAAEDEAGHAAAAEDEKAAAVEDEAEKAAAAEGEAEKAAAAEGDAGEKAPETDGEQVTDAAKGKASETAKEKAAEAAKENKPKTADEEASKTPVTAEIEYDEPVYAGSIEAVEETVYPEGSGASSEEMFAGFVDKSFGGNSDSLEDLTTFKKSTGASANDSLSGTDLAAYRFLASEISKIAAGERTSTIIEITPEVLGMGKTSWTAQDLGVDSIWQLDKNGAIVKDKNGNPQLNPQAVAKVQEKPPTLSSSKIINALLADCPYELYWYQKKSGTRTVSFAFASAYDPETRTYSLEISSNMLFKFSVADEYALGEYKVNPSIAKTVRNSVQNAKKIVSKYSGYGDVEKLLGYKNEICRLASFNSKVDADSSAYGNAWQLIWVFDGDPATKVVCEGYAKAFKYLCDQTDFDREIGCIIASGTMTDAGGTEIHMWNVVKMEDGKNYLVDATNCDVSSGDTNRLFLVGTQSKRANASGQSGYYFSSAGITYHYDKETRSVFGDSDLKLCGTNYCKWSTEYKTDREATCTRAGTKSIHCIICGKSKEGSQRSIPKKAHTWSSKYTVDKNPTKTSAGSRSKHCLVCGAINKSTIQSIPRLTGEWLKDSGGWWYLWEDGSYPFNMFEQIDGKVYRFNGAGYMVTDWQYIGGRWYYFDGSGAMATGWRYLGGTWYYFDGNGAMATGWQKVGSTWYHFDGSGAMQTGWQYLDGTWYYLDGSGAMATGWRYLGGTWYYFDGSGAMATGWRKTGGTWYYFDGSGAMQTGWRYLGGAWYYLSGSGAMATGWQYLGGGWYYFDESGAMKTGWQHLNGKWYYFVGSGEMVTGSRYIDGTWYNFDGNGAMK